MKTVILIGSIVITMAINPAVGIIYATVASVIVIAWLFAKMISSLISYTDNYTDEHEMLEIDRVEPWISDNWIPAQGQSHSTVFYGSKHAATDKPYQYQNGQTGPPES